MNHNLNIEKSDFVIKMAHAPHSFNFQIVLASARNLLALVWASSALWIANQASG
jgi:hypothetical protein